MSVSTLPLTWKTRPRTLRLWGAADEAATAWEAAATELESALAESGEQPLNLQAAASESDYSAEHLGRLVRQGKIPNAGRPNAPRIRLSDLPRKPGFVPGLYGNGRQPHLAKGEIARSLVLVGRGTDG